MVEFNLQLHLILNQITTAVIVQSAHSINYFFHLFQPKFWFICIMHYTVTLLLCTCLYDYTKWYGSEVSWHDLSDYKLCYKLSAMVQVLKNYRKIINSEIAKIVKPCSDVMNIKLLLDIWYRFRAAQISCHISPILDITYGLPCFPNNLFTWLAAEYFAQIVKE